MSEYQKTSSVLRIKDTCSRRLRKKTKAEEEPNAACGFVLWLSRSEALGGSRAATYCRPTHPQRKPNIVLFEYRNTNRTLQKSVVTRLSLSTVICVLIVSIRTGQLEELSLVPYLRIRNF